MDKEIQLVSAKEIGKMMSLSKWTILKMAQAGVLPHYRLGKKRIRFDKEKVLNWIAAHEVRGNLKII